MAPGTSVTENIKGESSSSMKKALPYIVCSLAALFYFYEFFLRVMPSAITHELMADFNTRAAGLGMLASMFYWGYTPMQVPAGLLVDRYGARKMLSIAILLCAISTFAFGITSNLAVASASRFVIGVGSAFAYIGPLILASRWFHAKRFALIAGLVQLLGCAGATFALAPVAAAAQHIGWRPTMNIAAVACCILSVLFWLIIRDYPENHPHHSRKPAFSLREQLKTVCQNKQIWWTAAHSFTTWAPITVFGALWGTPFLVAKYDYSSVEAASMLSVIWIGVAFGGPLLGWWSNAIHSRRKPLSLAAAIGLVSSIAMIYGDLSPTNLILSMLGVGVASSAQALTFGVIQDLMPPKVAGTAVGFNNMAVIASGITIQPLVAYLLDQRLIGSTNYSAHDYQAVFIVIPVIFIIGFITSQFFLKETHCQHQYES